MERSLFKKKIGFYGPFRTHLSSKSNQIQWTLCQWIDHPGYYKINFTYDRWILFTINYFFFNKFENVSHFIYQVEGTILAPSDPENWDPKSPKAWLVFSNLTGVTFQGNGIIDGSGSKWWEASCKKNKSNVTYKKEIMLLNIHTIFF